jgi:hypothetical protein
MACFFVFITILALVPMYFYKTKLAENPKEFRSSEKHFINIEVIANNVSPLIAPLIKAGDIQKDYNGEINVQIEEIKSIVPAKIGIINFEGKDINIDSPRKDIYLRLKVRYEKVGNDLFLSPGVVDLRAGSNFTLKFPDYYLQCDIVKVNKE